MVDASLTIESNITHLFTQLNDQTIPFETIQFSISKQSWMVPTVAMYH